MTAQQVAGKEQEAEHQQALQHLKDQLTAAIQSASAAQSSSAAAVAERTKAEQQLDTQKSEAAYLRHERTLVSPSALQAKLLDLILHDTVQKRA